MGVKADVYDDYAAEYTAMMAEREGRGIAAEPMMPVLLDLAGDISGLAVLDAGCGAGYLSRILAARGAHVTGVDIAARLVAHARAQDPDGTIRIGALCRHADLERSALLKATRQKLARNRTTTALYDSEGFRKG